MSIAPIIAPVLTMTLEKVIWWAKGYWNVAFKQNFDNYKEKGKVKGKIITSSSRHGLTDSRNTWSYRKNRNWIEVKKKFLNN